MPKSAGTGVTPDYWDEACKHLSRRDRVMKKLIPQFGEARLQSRGDAFTTLARSIVGQQISVKAAQSVWERLVALLGAPATRVAPAMVEAHAAGTLREAGLSLRKAEYLLDLARHFSAGAVHVPQWRQMDDDRGTGGDPRHRPLDRGDVPDLPPDAAERAAAGRPGPAQGHQPELLQRRAGVARRSPRSGRCLDAVPLGRHLVHLAQPGPAAGRLLK
jgi:HhH-GPD superfamily base excision DNA repair protein